MVYAVPENVRGDVSIEDEPGMSAVLPSTVTLVAGIRRGAIRIESAAVEVQFPSMETKLL